MSLAGCRSQGSPSRRTWAWGPPTREQLSDGRGLEFLTGGQNRIVRAELEDNRTAPYLNDRRDQLSSTSLLQTLSLLVTCQPTSRLQKLYR